MPISVAIEGAGASMADCCTKRGLLPLQLADGGVYYQPCYYCENAVETIISPQAILDGSDTFVEWSQTGYKDNSPGTLRFYSDSGLASMIMTLNRSVLQEPRSNQGQKVLLLDFYLLVTCELETS
jgi:hypothetical protein